MRVEAMPSTYASAVARMPMASTGTNQGTVPNR